MAWGRESVAPECQVIPFFCLEIPTQPGIHGGRAVGRHGEDWIWMLAPSSTATSTSLPNHPSELGEARSSSDARCSLAPLASGGIEPHTRSCRAVFFFSWFLFLEGPSAGQEVSQPYGAVLCGHAAAVCGGQCNPPPKNEHLRP